MKKTLIKRLYHKAKIFGISLSDIDAYSEDIDDIEQSVNVSADDLHTIFRLISRGLDNIKFRWLEAKKYKSGDIKRFILHYGEENGIIEYEKCNNKKRKGLANTVDYWINKGHDYDTAVNKVAEVQRTRSEKSPASKKGSELSTRSIKFWINAGLTLEDAANKVKEIQCTNGLPFYEAKYGKELGATLFNDRIARWQSSRKSNPNYAITCYMQGHGLDQYKIRHGEQAEEKWKAYKQRFAHRGSKESEKCFAEILNWLSTNNILYNFGPHNSEFILIANKRAWFYDLTIPSLKTIIEYHGESFHPNKNKLSVAQWETWKNPFDHAVTANIQFERDRFKQTLAMQHGFTYYTIYSSESTVKAPEILNELKRAQSDSDISISTS